MTEERPDLNDVERLLARRRSEAGKGVPPALGHPGEETERVTDVYSRLTGGGLAPMDVDPPLARTVRPAEGDIWEEAEVKVRAEEPEKELETLALEEQEGIDDPVRMYLREIGKVFLLSADDEKRLARQMEEGKHIEQVERRFLEQRGRLPSSSEIVLALLEEVQQLSRVYNATVKHLGLSRGTLAQRITDARFRSTIDAEM